MLDSHTPSIAAAEKPRDEWARVARSSLLDAGRDAERYRWLRRQGLVNDKRTDEAMAAEVANG